MHHIHPIQEKGCSKCSILFLHASGNKIKKKKRERERTNNRSDNNYNKLICKYKSSVTKLSKTADWFTIKSHVMLIYSRITWDIIPNGVLWVLTTPPLPPQSVHNFMQLLDFAPVPPQFSHISKQETSMSLSPPKIDSSKLKKRSYLQQKNMLD